MSNLFDPQKLIRKIANSRFLMISALLHVLLVLLFGGTVLFNKYVEPPDFDAGGGDFLTATDVAEPPQPPAQEMPTPPSSLAPPPVSTPTTALSAIVSMNSTAPSFTMPVAQNIAPTLSNNLTDQIAKAPPTNPLGTGPMASLPAAMGGRGTGRRASVLAQNGGKVTSEQAVVKALRWLQKVQNPADGTWGTGKYRGAMTGLATLCFLGHGETPATSREFGIVVSKSLKAIVDEGTKAKGILSFNGALSKGNESVYEHAIGAYALGEAYTMTKDETITPVLTQAVAYITDGQRPDGGWAYSYDKGADEPKKVPKSDTSVSGWQVQALKAAHLTGLTFPAVDPALDTSMRNFDRVFDPKDGTFGYRKPGDRRNGSLTGVGVLCKLFWLGKSDALVRDGLKNIEGHDVKYDSADANIYSWYYDTQACFQAQGPSWDRWNRQFQDELVSHQSPDGSWPATGGKETGGMNGADINSQIYRTTLCALMLEVYYRYLPTSKESNAGAGTPTGL